MKNFTKVLIALLLIQSNLLIAKNSELDKEGIAIKNITCESATNPPNNKDKYKILTMLIYNKNKFDINSKVLNFSLFDKDNDRLFNHRFELRMAPQTAAKEVLNVPDCDDSFFGNKIIYKFYIEQNE